MNRPNNKISEQTWAEADVAGGFEIVGLKGKAGQQTEVRVCYDRSALHIRFECFEDRMGALLTKHTEDAGPVWQDDSVEVWVSPYSVAGVGKCYRFVVNALGARAYLVPDGEPRSEEWRGRVARSSDRWTAEMVIPYSALRPLGRNEYCWRINFCRNEGPHGELSSWSGVEESFATYSRFGKLVPPDARFTFNPLRGALRPMEPDLSACGGTRPLAATEQDLSEESRVIPKPQEMHRRTSKGPFVVTPETLIVVNTDAGEVDIWAAEELNDAIQAVGGARLRIVPSVLPAMKPSAAKNLILLGEPGRNEALRSVCREEGVRLPRVRPDVGAHVVDVLGDRIVVCGHSAADTFHGVQTLKQLLTVDPDGAVRVPPVAIRDFPRFRFRGVHLLASKDALGFLGKLIDRVLAPLKVNHIVLQTDKVAWRSHPELADPSNHMSTEDVKQLVEIARRHHIAVTPLVQSPGHLEWAFRDGRNLDIAEDPERPYCYCMSNPRSYEFIFSVIDEAIELFGDPEYVHMGRDEFDAEGQMPADEQCAIIGKERLYFQDALKIHEHLESRGRKMMMWGDVMIRPGFRNMVDELPKDIVIADWQYMSSETYPTLDFYSSQGFPVVGCTWYDPRNIATFSRYASSRGAFGMLQTTWTGFQSEEAVLSHYPEQVYAYVLSAAWAWNPLSPELSDLPYKPEGVFREAWSGRCGGKRSEFAVVSLGPWLNVSRADSGRAIGWLGVGRGNDLRGLPEGIVNIECVPYELSASSVQEPGAVMLGGDGMTAAFPRRVDGIEVGCRLAALYFLHGCAYEADPGANVGSYIVRYEDGEAEEIPLRFGRDIHAWDGQSVGMAYGLAWKGRAQDGRTVGVSSLKWVNPRNRVTVTSIDFIATDREASPFLLAVTAEL